MIVEVPDALVDVLAEQVAARVADRLVSSVSDHSHESDPWMCAKSASKHLDCPVSRVHDLVQRRLLTPHRDGTRLLFKRSDLDAYVEGAQ